MSLPSALPLMAMSPVLPVVVVDDPATAVEVARALAAGGIGIVELTLRTPNALACIERIAAEVPDVVIGAGTVTTPADVELAVGAGARFLVSPGTPPELATELLDTGLPCLPGCATLTEALALRDLGFTELKFFPAAAAGGPAYLAAIAGPLPDLRFCPTGGVTLADAPSYLALGNVSCVGGSWLTPADAVAAGDWGRITGLAATAVAALAALADSLADS